MLNAKRVPPVSGTLFILYCLKEIFEIILIKLCVYAPL